MKKTILYFFYIILLTSCFHDKKLDGNWIDTTSTYKATISFKDGTHYSNNPINDSLSYRTFQNKIYFGINSKPTKYSVDSDTLTFFFENDEEWKYLKARTYNITLDLILNSGLEINLPKIKKKNHLYKNQFLRFDFEIYVGKDNEENLKVSFANQMYNLDSNLYKHLLNYISKRTLLDPFYQNKNAIFIDESISIQNFMLFKQQLRNAFFSCYTSNYFICESTEEYSSINSINIHFPILSDKEASLLNIDDSLYKRLPPPPPLPPEVEFNLLRTHGKKVVISSTTTNIEKEIIRLRQQDSLLIIIPSFEKNATYSDYLKFWEACFSAYFSIRNNYAVNNYGSNMDALDKQKKKLVKKKFPIRVKGLNNQEKILLFK